MVSFYLVGSKVEADFLAVLFGFAFLLVVFFPRDLFVSGKKKKKKVRELDIKMT